MSLSVFVVHCLSESVFELVQLLPFSTVDQICRRLGKSRASIGKVLRKLVAGGRVVAYSRSVSGRRGRPELVYCRKSRKQTVREMSVLEHQLSLSDVLISCELLGESSSTFRTKARSGLRLGLEPTGLVPDAVLSLESVALSKSLLFFIEVDMGTESLISRVAARSCIAWKIASYRTAFATHRYHKVASSVGSYDFVGFRTLFVCDSDDRRDKIARLCGRLGQADFIWCTSHCQLLSEGLGGFIWRRGGDVMRFESLLGSLAPNRA